MEPAWIADLPTDKGSYILSFLIPTPTTCTIGKLGEWTLEPGIYHYCGSAHGSGGIRARLRHHLRDHSRPHWHLDYLHPSIDYRAAIMTITTDALECQFAQMLASLPGAFIPVPGFGASDCRRKCSAHLIAAAIEPDAIVTHLKKSSKAGIRYNGVILNDLEVT